MGAEKPLENPVLTGVGAITGASRAINAKTPSAHNPSTVCRFPVMRRSAVPLRVGTLTTRSPDGDATTANPRIDANIDQIGYQIRHHYRHRE